METGIKEIVCLGWETEDADDTMPSLFRPYFCCASVFRRFMDIFCLVKIRIYRGHYAQYLTTCTIRYANKYEHCFIDQLTEIYRFIICSFVVNVVARKCGK